MTAGARRACACAVLALAALSARPATAATKLEGDYQLMLDLRKQDRSFPWDWQSKNNDSYNGANLRLFSTPRAGIEAFLRVEADFRTPENGTPRPVFQYREADVRFLWQKKAEAVDTYVFSRQDRFWVENYLIRVVDSSANNDRWGPNAQGVRVDTHGFGGFHTSWIASDFSGQYNPDPVTNNGNPGSPLKTDDAYIGRIRREFFRDRSLRLGMTWNRKEENEPLEAPTNCRVLAFDSRYRWKGVEYMLEYSESRSPLRIGDVYFPTQLQHDLTVFGKSTGVRLSDRSVVVAEIRALRMGTPLTGYLFVVPTYWRRGPLYENRLGDGSRDETGFNINAWYLVPQRAITLTSNYRKSQKFAYERRHDTEFYNEAYVEFVNGFTGKTYVRNRETVRTLGSYDETERHDDVFTELQVENALAWLRFEAKFKDVGQVFHKQLYAIENAINLTSKLKVYNRFAFGDDPNFLRKAIFSQLQYRPTGSMEMFLQYGPDWIGDSSTPVDDGDLEGSGEQRDMVKLILKGWF